MAQYHHPSCVMRGGKNPCKCPPDTRRQLPNPLPPKTPKPPKRGR